jgi:hypothetical protein
MLEALPAGQWRHLEVDGRQAEAACKYDIFYLRGIINLLHFKINLKKYKHLCQIEDL